VLLGLSALSWAVLGTLQASADERWTAVRLSVVALHLAVSVLFMVRRPEVTGGGVRAAMLALPSLVASGIALKLAPPPSEWSGLLTALLVAATVWTVTAMATLGRSFAVLPSRRLLVTKGLFRMVRHPIYLGELALLQVVGAASDSRAVMAVCLLAIPLVGLRILAEERVLSLDPAWGAFSRRTRWRLLPGLW
jgi:protein-S-isoprenylcysteine O-methyltransferase Ste14